MGGCFVVCFSRFFVCCFRLFLAFSSSSSSFLGGGGGVFCAFCCCCCLFVWGLLGGRFFVCLFCFVLFSLSIWSSLLI